MSPTIDRGDLPPLAATLNKVLKSVARRPHPHGHFSFQELKTMLRFTDMMMMMMRRTGPPWGDADRRRRAR
jgi:hypothetical protein